MYSKQTLLGEEAPVQKKSYSKYFVTGLLVGAVAASAYYGNRTTAQTHLQAVDAPAEEAVMEVVEPVADPTADASWGATADPAAAGGAAAAAPAVPYGYQAVTDPWGQPVTDPWGQPVYTEIDYDEQPYWGAQGGAAGYPADPNAPYGAAGTPPPPGYAAGPVDPNAPAWDPNAPQVDAWGNPIPPQLDAWGNPLPPAPPGMMAVQDPWGQPVTDAWGNPVYTQWEPLTPLTPQAYGAGGQTGGSLWGWGTDPAAAGAQPGYGYGQEPVTPLTPYGNYGYAQPQPGYAAAPAPAADPAAAGW